MEVVSRVFEIPQKDWMREIVRFWDIFYNVFDLETNNPQCGTHVHIRPLYSDYSMQALKQIAYAVIVFEKHVLEILPESRRNHDYCKPNTNRSPKLENIFRGGRNVKSYATLRNEINRINTPAELCTFMQGDSDRSRYVLWNLENIIGQSGTIEFRGIPETHSGQEVVLWVLFAIGFILHAQEQVCSLLCFSKPDQCATDRSLG